MYAKKNTCHVCGKKIEFALVKTGNGRLVKRAFHEGEVPSDATVIDYKEVCPTHRKNLREAIPHDEMTSKVVFDATGMNRFTMITDVINAMKDSGMDIETAKEVRREMFAKGSNYESNIATAAKYGITIIRNNH